jgi:hypothetical protein
MSLPPERPASSSVPGPWAVLVPIVRRVPRWLGPGWLTGAGLLATLGAVALAAGGTCAAVVPWLVGRVLDGVDGALERLRGNGQWRRSEGVARQVDHGRVEEGVDDHFGDARRGQALGHARGSAFDGPPGQAGLGVRRTGVDDADTAPTRLT